MNQETEIKRPKKRFSPLTVIFLLSGGLFLVFLLVSGLIFFTKSSQHLKMDSDNGSGLFASQKEGVGILEVNGVILNSKKILKRLKKLEDSKKIKSIVLRVNSPGGAVAPSQEIYEALKKVKKPVVTSMDSLAASGGYYISCGTKKIFANPGTLTGSIGVIMEFANLKKLYEWAKVERYAIKTGKFKDTGSDHREMTPEEREFMQNLVDNVLLQFKTAVSQGRGLSMSAVTPVADGRIFTGEQAKQLKLVDEIGTLDDAVKEAAKLAGLSEEDPKVYYPEEPKKSMLEYLMDSRGGDDEEEASTTSILGMIGKALLHKDLKTMTPFLDPGLYLLWTGSY